MQMTPCVLKGECVYSFRIPVPGTEEYRQDCCCCIGAVKNVSMEEELGDRKRQTRLHRKDVDVFFFLVCQGSLF